MSEIKTIFRKEELFGKRVRVYWNLTKALYSVQHKVGNQWKLLCYLDSFLPLVDVQFLVSENQRQRVLATRQKNVHAFIEGTVETFSYPYPFPSLDNDLYCKITYNPYKYSSFIAKRHDGKTYIPIYNAQKVLLDIEYTELVRNNTDKRHSVFIPKITGLLHFPLLKRN